jgi:hypothetical protein
MRAVTPLCTNGSKNSSIASIGTLSVPPINSRLRRRWSGCLDHPGLMYVAANLLLLENVRAGTQQYGHAILVAFRRYRRRAYSTWTSPVLSPSVLSAWACVPTSGRWPAAAAAAAIARATSAAWRGPGSAAAIPSAATPPASARLVLVTRLPQA